MANPNLFDEQLAVPRFHMAGSVVGVEPGFLPRCRWLGQAQGLQRTGLDGIDAKVEVVKQAQRLDGSWSSGLASNMDRRNKPDWRNAS